MQNSQISAADWFKNAPSFIPVEEVRALRDRAAAHIKREREEVLRRAAELDADLLALVGEPEQEEPKKSGSIGKTGTAAEEKPNATWSNRAIVTYFAQNNPGAKAAQYSTFLGGFRPRIPEETTKSNVYDALKTLKKDGLIRTEGRRGDYQYYYQGDAKTRP